jgi:hypothetical protein
MKGIHPLNEILNDLTEMCGDWEVLRKRNQDCLTAKLEV